MIFYRGIERWDQEDYKITSNKWTLGFRTYGKIILFCRYSLQTMPRKHFYFYSDPFDIIQIEAKILKEFLNNYS